MLSAVYEAALSLQSVCRSHDWQFCFIGGIVVQRWGDPRQTVDLTLLTNFEDEQFIDALLSSFSPRRGDARAFALQHRVLLLRHTNGVALDVALAGLPFERRTIQRSSIWLATEHAELRTCSAEDLVVHKAFASRFLDWADIERVLMRQGQRLDTQLIMRELTPLAELKEQPEIVDQLRALIEQHCK